MKNHVADLIGQALALMQSRGELPAEAGATIVIDHTKDKAHGDLASNIALALAKAAQRPPR
jgi:arginyl-tRNA synthetase